MVNRILLILPLLISGCIYSHKPSPSNSTLMVYKGQYVVEASAGAEWCDGDPSAIEECQTEEHGRDFLVTPLGDGFSVIREGHDVGIEDIEPKIVEYKREEDLCFSDFPGQVCSPNYVINIDQTPNDPLLTNQWALKDIRAEEVQEFPIQGVEPVAVIDTGVDCSHPDINCLGEFNAITNTAGPGSAMDDNGHGTHVAGTIGSYCNNGIGACGVGSGIPILACKFLQAKGGGALSDAISCIIWAREKGARIINASWGCTQCFSEPLLSSIKQSRDAGLLVFAAAAGNDGVNNDDKPHYPSSYVLDNYDPIISVAAIDEKRERAKFSNYGSTGTDISAPGVNIIATWPGGEYKTISGTSMATPHIAASSSIIAGLGGRPKESILSSASSLSTPKYTLTGGALDLKAAIAAARGVPECKKAKLKTCNKTCETKFKCNYSKQKTCRAKCSTKWCQAVS